MAKKRYTVSSPEAVDYLRRDHGIEAEEGSEVSLDLEEEPETALVAAGWLEHAQRAKKEGDK